MIRKTYISEGKYTIEIKSGEHTHKRTLQVVISREGKEAGLKVRIFPRNTMKRIICKWDIYIP